jgi:hypothetical protein
MDVLSGGSVDGDVAYQQFHRSENPYDPIFLGNRTGTSTVGPLQQVESTAGKTKKKQGADSDGSSQQ